MRIVSALASVVAVCGMLITGSVHANHKTETQKACPIMTSEHAKEIGLSKKQTAQVQKLKAEAVSKMTALNKKIAANQAKLESAKGEQKQALRKENKALREQLEGAKEDIMTQTGKVLTAAQYAKYKEIVKSYKKECKDKKKCDYKKNCKDKEKCKDKAKCEKCKKEGKTCDKCKKAAKKK